MADHGRGLSERRTMMAPDTINPAVQESFRVGGVELPRPFRVRRLGHFGVDIQDPEAGRRFYERLLGFRVSDELEMGERVPPELKGKVGSTVGYFSRHGTDHHSFVWFPRRARQVLLADEHKAFPEVTTNQITWQVGSLREVVSGIDYMRKRDVRIRRTGRDNPGSNWHFYPFDPEGHTNELYYGIEQIGWEGLSKPPKMHTVSYHQAPDLPHRSEYAEVNDDLVTAIDPRSGWRAKEWLEEKYDVGGVLLGRPFKVVRIGPVRLFVRDMDKVVTFYRDTLGLTVTEEVTWHGHRCVFLRCNTEHHTMALYPVALRAELGLRPDTTLMAFGLQVGDYTQLKDAVSFLKREGVTIKHLPPELFPGIDYSAFALDLDGHAMQLYYYMEQIGWDGKPRPASLRPKVDNANWPDTVPAQADTFLGEAFLGPLG
jgi:catechol 2,3-dioxygenase-like lactoylglutathione lyase family enzyme